MSYPTHDAPSESRWPLDAAEWRSAVRVVVDRVLRRSRHPGRHAFPAILSKAAADYAGHPSVSGQFLLGIALRRTVAAGRRHTADRPSSHGRDL